MNKILIWIGLFFILIVIIYLTTKINDYFKFKEEQNHSYKIDRDDEKE